MDSVLDIIASSDIYQAAVAALNTLQSNFTIVDAIRKSGRGMNKNAIPEMIEWCRRIGYEVCVQLSLSTLQTACDCH